MPTPMPTGSACRRTTSLHEETEGLCAHEAAGADSAQASVSFGGWHGAAVEAQLHQESTLPQGGMNPLYDGPKPSAIPRPPSPAAGEIWLRHRCQPLKQQTLFCVHRRLL